MKYLVIAQKCRYTDDIAGRSRGAMVIPSSGADKLGTLQQVGATAGSFCVGRSAEHSRFFLRDLAGSIAAAYDTSPRRSGGGVDWSTADGYT